MLQTFRSPQNNGLDYHIRLSCPELTFLCPKTGQPDFASVSIDYVPDQRCIEFKSLKLYLWSFRDKGIGYEKLSCQVFRDLYQALTPKSLTLEITFNVRGGITTSIVHQHPPKA